MIFQKKELNYLKEIEESLRTAYYSDWTRNVSQSRLDNILEIYKKRVGEYNLCSHCPQSILNFLKKVAYYYYKDIEELEKNAKEKNTK